VSTTRLGDIDVTELGCGRLAMCEQPARLASLLGHLTARKDPAHE
jgi:hypothetical protein